MIPCMFWTGQWWEMHLLLASLGMEIVQPGSTKVDTFNSAFEVAIIRQTCRHCPILISQARCPSTWLQGLWSQVLRPWLVWMTLSMKTSRHIWEGKAGRYSVYSWSKNVFTCTVLQDTFTVLYPQANDGQNKLFTQKLHSEIVVHSSMTVNALFKYDLRLRIRPYSVHGKIYHSPFSTAPPRK